MWLFKDSGFSTPLFLEHLLKKLLHNILITRFYRAWPLNTINKVLYEFQAKWINGMFDKWTGNINWPWCFCRNFLSLQCYRNLCVSYVVWNKTDTEMKLLMVSFKQEISIQLPWSKRAKRKHWERCWQFHWKKSKGENIFSWVKEEITIERGVFREQAV